MLTEEQNVAIEGLQRTALKIIYGFGKNYKELLEESKLETLEERRKKAFLKFALTLSNSARYSEWFPIQENVVNLRKSNTYQEHYAKTNRLYKSPLFTMRRLLNEHINDTIITPNATIEENHDAIV